MSVGIIDYGLGNLRSVEQALLHLGAQSERISDPAGIERANMLILPGVGAFGDGMAGLAERKLVEPIRAYARNGKPLLGICLGLQLFFAKSEEAPNVEGLGLLQGDVRKFTGAAFGAKGGLKVPQMGWNQLSFPNPHALFKDVAPGAHVYFVHSYYVAPSNRAEVLAESEYGVRFCAAAGKGKVAGCQFHPEKSQTVGLGILKNFLLG